MSELTRVIKNIKQKEKKIVTPRFDDWLIRTGGEFVLTDEELKLLKKLLGKGYSRLSGSFTGSQAMRCERAQLFRFLGMPQRGRVEPVLNHKFIDGTWRHARWQLSLRRAIPGTEIEVPVSAPSVLFKGSLDALNRQERWGFELKGWSWMSNVIRNGPLDYHQHQAVRYWLATDEDPSIDVELDKWVFVYEDKRSQDWSETVVKRSTQLEREVKRELRRLNNAVRKEELPEVLDECWKETGTTFRSCPYANVCLRVKDWKHAERLAQKGQGEVGDGQRGKAKKVILTRRPRN